MTPFTRSSTIAAGSFGSRSASIECRSAGSGSTHAFPWSCCVSQASSSAAGAASQASIRPPPSSLFRVMLAFSRFFLSAFGIRDCSSLVLEVIEPRFFRALSFGLVLPSSVPNLSSADTLFALMAVASSCVGAEPEDRREVADDVLVCFFRVAPRSPVLFSAAADASKAHAEICAVSFSSWPASADDGSLLSRWDRLLADDGGVLLAAVGDSSLPWPALAGGASAAASAADSLVWLGLRTGDAEASVASACDFRLARGCRGTWLPMAAHPDLRAFLLRDPASVHAAWAWDDHSSVSKGMPSAHFTDYSCSSCRSPP
mmetsp:Transcript_53713/g.96552  ORF Transcript_53713/g.96552 Transcript_53713/m.96552 type:complete len:316 (+) Transcript_53713:1790-2737(+)